MTEMSYESEFYRYKKSVCLPGNFVIDTHEIELLEVVRVDHNTGKYLLHIQVSCADNWQGDLRLGMVPQGYYIFYTYQESTNYIAWNSFIKTILGKEFHAIKNGVWNYLLEVLENEDRLTLLLPINPLDGMFAKFEFQLGPNNTLEVSTDIKDITYPVINFTKETFNLRLVLKEYIVLWSSLASQVPKDMLWETATELDKWFIMNHDMTYQESLNQGNLNRMTPLP